MFIFADISVLCLTKILLSVGYDTKNVKKSIPVVPIKVGCGVRGRDGRNQRRKKNLKTPANSRKDMRSFLKRDELNRKCKNLFRERGYSL